MKLLLFSDVHVNQRACERLWQLSRQVDLVVGAGDFGAVRRGINKTINWLSNIEKPAILVPGNAESFEELQNACTHWPYAVVLHGNQTEINGITFFGIGGGIPITPFGSWSYDFSEEQSLELLKDCPEHCVLVSHSPPYGLLDLSSGGKHLGSMSIRSIVEKKSPLLVVCGHIHESAAKITRFRQTDIVNAGPGGVIYHLNISHQT